MDTSVSLTVHAHDRLRADLLAGHWQPGQKLLMHQLRERYEIGASPLREALNRLASEGLVVHNDQRGFVVAQASAEGLRDLVRTRIALESMAMGLAFARRTPQWEEDLVLAFHRLSRAPRSVQTDSYEENPSWERLHRLFISHCCKTATRRCCSGFASSSTTRLTAIGNYLRARPTSDAMSWTSTRPFLMRPWPTAWKTPAR
jgi:DNA-binding GntR family transcriptional regulator